MAEGDSSGAPITGVTVFRDGARIVRSGSVEVEPGPRPVVVGELTWTLTLDPGQTATIKHRFHDRAPGDGKPCGASRSL